MRGHDYAFDVVAIALAVLVATVRPSPRFVESAYANGLYPIVDGALHPLTSALPFCLGDVLALAAVVWGIRHAIVAIRRGRIARGALRLLAALGAIGVWFVAAWGLGYDRVSLSAKIVMRPDTVDAAAVSRFADRVVDELTRRAPAAHRRRFDDRALGVALEPTFEEAIHRLGDAARFAPPRIKPTLFQKMMELSATSGFTDPWTHEVNVDDGAFFFERPAYYAHEWAHVAGFNDEAEANYISVLACTRARDPLLAYAGWMLVWFNLPSDVRVTHRMGRLAYDDLAAVRARVLARMNRRVATAQRIAYDAYLKGNRVKAGIASYGLFIRWMVGARFDATGLPVVRPGVARDASPRTG